MNLELLTKQVANLTRVLGSYLKSELKVLKNKDIEKKGINDFVTYVDKTSEERLVFDLEKIKKNSGSFRITFLSGCIKVHLMANYCILTTGLLKY